MNERDETQAGPVVPIHFPRQHFGCLICGYCSLDMSLPVHPVEWPCKPAREQGLGL